MQRFPFPINPFVINEIKTQWAVRGGGGVSKGKTFIPNYVKNCQLVENGQIRIIIIYISEYKSDLEDKLQTYNKINGAVRRHFGKQMNKETKLRIHNITAKAALKFGSEAWVLKKREEQRLEAAQMKFFRHLLGITKLDKEKNQCIREKTGAQSIVKEIKHYQ